MQKKIKILSILILMFIAVFPTAQADAQLNTVVSAIWRRVGTYLMPVPNTLNLGASSDRIPAGYFTDLNVSGTCTGCGVGGSGGNGNVATSTNETAGSLAYWTSNSATPALLGLVATTTLSGNNGISTSAGIGALVGGSNATIGLSAISANSLLGNQTSGSAVPTALATSTLNIGGNAGTASALVANGANCTSGNYPLGVDQSGAVEDCTAIPGVSSSVKLPSYIVKASGGDFTTIQGALDQCGVDGGGTIFLADSAYSQGGTGLTFKGSNCNIYGRMASTTINFTGATTLFKTNSAAGQYQNNGIHNIVVSGDGNASGIAFDLSDMGHFTLEDTVTDSVGTWIRYNDTQDISFYNTINKNTATTLVTFGINASSTNPWNGNTIESNFIGCSANCTAFQMNNGNGNSFKKNFLEPGSTTGTVGVKVFDSLLASNDGVFNNVFKENYVEGNATGWSVANSVGSGGGIQRNIFENNVTEANTLDWSLASNVVGLNTFINEMDSNFGSSITTFQGPVGFATSTQLANVATTQGATVAIGKGNGVGGSILLSENRNATSTTPTISWNDGTTQLYRTGTAGTSITFSNYLDGQTLKLIVCNPNASAGAITWVTPILWSGGSAPSQTTTANKCDVWSFVATMATSSMKIFGAQTPNF